VSDSFDLAAALQALVAGDLNVQAASAVSAAPGEATSLISRPTIGRLEDHDVGAPHDFTTGKYPGPPPQVQPQHAPVPWAFGLELAIAGALALVVVVRVRKALPRWAGRRRPSRRVVIDPP
jgi:hypothetical protein